MTDREYFFNNVSDKFQFGMHKGEALCQVIANSPHYIYWCLDNIPSFRISLETLKQIRHLFPMFIITEEFTNHLGKIVDRSDFADCDEDDDYDDGYWESDDDMPTYDRYNGSYAQDEMGYSDDDIDTIFDGDPSAYWNID
jgi:hypothetical protein